jgi:hypothetical protein
MDLGKFNPDVFETHETVFINLLAQTYGVQGENLKYIVHDVVIPAEFVDDAEWRMYQLPLTGKVYSMDNKSVYHLLKSFLINISGWTWIEPYDTMENGHDDVDKAMEKCKASVLTSERPSKVGPEELSRKRDIGLETAKATLDMMTAWGSNGGASNVEMVKSRSLTLTQTKAEKAKLLLCNKCANVFTNGKYTKVMPMASQKEAAESLIDFTDDVGIPETLVMDTDFI